MRTVTPLAVILAVALAVRVALVAATPDFAPEHDAADYDRLAQSLAAENSFPATVYAEPGSPTALRPPAYPLVLGAVYKIFGSQSWTIGRLVGALLGTLTVLLLFVVAREVWDSRTGLVVAGLAAVYPPLVMVNGSLLSEALFLPIMLGVVVAVLWSRREPARWGPLLAVGFLCGLALLTRSVGGALLIPAAVGVISVSGLSRRRRALSAAVVVFVALLVVAPWSLRNTLVFDRFVPLTTQGGPTAAGVYNSVAARDDRYWGVWRVPFWLPQFKPLVGGTLDEAEIDRELGSAARRYAANNIGYVIELGGANTLRFFDAGPSHALITRSWHSEMGIPASLRRATTISFYIVVAIAAMALPSLARRRRGPPRAPLFLWLVPLALYLSVIPIHGGMRYRVPIDPFVLLAAGTALTPLVLAPIRRSRRRAPGRRS